MQGFHLKIASKTTAKMLYIVSSISLLFAISSAGDSTFANSCTASIGYSSSGSVASGTYSYGCYLTTCDGEQIDSDDWQSYCANYEASFEEACPDLVDCGCDNYSYDSSSSAYNSATWTSCECPSW